MSQPLGDGLLEEICNLKTGWTDSECDLMRLRIKPMQPINVGK